MQVSIGEKIISAYATGTAVLLSALPPPPELALIAQGKWQHPTSKKKLSDARRQIEETIRKNKLYYQLTEVSRCQNRIFVVFDFVNCMFAYSTASNAR